MQDGSHDGSGMANSLNHMGAIDSGPPQWPDSEPAPPDALDPNQRVSKTHFYLLLFEFD